MDIIFQFFFFLQSKETIGEKFQKVLLIFVNQNY